MIGYNGGQVADKLAGFPRIVRMSPKDGSGNLTTGIRELLMLVRPAFAAFEVAASHRLHDAPEDEPLKVMSTRNAGRNPEDRQQFGARSLKLQSDRSLRRALRALRLAKAGVAILEAHRSVPRHHVCRRLRCRCHITQSLGDVLPVGAPSTKNVVLRRFSLTETTGHLRICMHEFILFHT